MKKLLFALMLLSIGSQAQTEMDSTRIDSISISIVPKVKHINHHFWDAGVAVQKEATSLAVNYSYRSKQWLIRTGLVGSIYQLTGTTASEYSAQARLGVDYHFLNYGFLHSWYDGKKQYRWSPFVHVGALSGVRHVNGYENVMYEDTSIDRWNYLQSFEAAVGVKYSPKNIFGWHTSGWLTFVGAYGIISSNMDGNYGSFNIGVNYILGY